MIRGARHRAPKPGSLTAGRWMKFWCTCALLAFVATLLTASEPLATTGKLSAPKTDLPSAQGDFFPRPPVQPRAVYGPFMAEETTPVQPVQVEVSQPLRLEVPRIGFQVRVEGDYFGDFIDPPFDPATVADTVYFDTSRGTRPGSSTSNTSYFAGHTCRKPGCLAAFDVLDQHLRVGDDIYLTTEASAALGVRLHYEVSKSFKTPQETLPSVTKVWKKIPNRLVFITCNLREDGGQQTDNHVFFAKYVGLE